jgi:hypothetical protein
MAGNEAMSDSVTQEAVEFFRRSEDFASHYKQESLDDLRFSYGNQWPAEMQNQRHLDGRPWFTINEVDAFVRNVVNQMRQQRPRIKAHGVNNSSDEKIAEIITGITRHIEELSDASNAYDTAGEFAVRQGWGYWRLRADYVDDDSFDQDIRIEPIWNPYSVAFDPYSHAPDGADQTQCLISDTVSKDEFRRMYPTADEENFSLRAVGDTTGEWLSKDSIRLAEYFRIDQERHKLVHLSDGSAWWSDELPDAGLLERAGIQVKGDRMSRRKKVCWYKITAVQTLEERILPGKYIPVVPVYGANLVIDGKVQRFGMVRMAKDPQRILNYTKTSIIETVALAPKAKYVAAEDAVENTLDEWQKANVSAIPVLRYKHRDDAGNEIPMPQRQAPEPPPAGWLAASQEAHDALQRVLGMWDPAMRTDGPMSGKALNAEQQQSDMSNFHFYDNLTRSIKHTGRIILGWVPTYYGKRRVLRIIGADGKPDLVTINDDQAVGKIENDLTIGQYDVVMETGPGYNSKRQEAAAALGDLVKAYPPLMQVAGDLLMRNLDFPNAEIIADRLAASNPLAQIDDKSDIPPRAQMMIKQLQQQLQQAGQAMQQAGMVQKFRADVEGQKDAADLHKTMLVESEKTKREQMWAQVEMAKETLEDRTWQHDIAMRETGKLGAAEIDGIVKLLLAEKERQVREVEMAANREEAELDRASRSKVQ